jgi:hypothetical protein
MRVSVPLPLGEAVILHRCLKRYHESEKPELLTDSVEWRVLIDVLGELERRLPLGQDLSKVYERARRDLAKSDAPF